MRIFIAAFVIAVSVLARAQNVAPLGEREALTGNAGIGRSGSAAAGYYNPAALEFGRKTRLVGSGSLLQRTELVNRNDAFEFSGRRIATASLFGSTIWSWDDFALSLGIFSPATYELSAPLTTTATSEFRGKIFSSTSMVLVGPSWAYKMGDSLSAGLSLFYESLQSRLGFAIFQQSSAGGAIFRQAGYQDVEVSNSAIQPVVGLAWHPTDQLQLGFRVETPVIDLPSSAKGVSWKWSNSNTGGTVSNEEYSAEPELKTEVHLKQPLALGLGTQVLLTDRLDLLLDVKYTEKVDRQYFQFWFTNIRKEYLEVALGAEYAMGTDAAILGGINWSQLPDRTEDEASYMITLGRVGIEATNETMFGVFYNTSDNTSRSSLTKESAWGLVLSSGIYL